LNIGLYQKSIFADIQEISHHAAAACSVGRGAGLVIERLQNLGSTPDAVAHRCVLGKDTFMLFPTLGPSSLPVVVTQPDKRHANRAASVLE